MHTCDGCYYLNKDGSCAREYYPDLERGKREAANAKRTITFCLIAIAVIITTIYIACVL